MLTLSFLPLYGLSGYEQVENIIGKKRNIQRILLTTSVFVEKAGVIHRGE